MYEITDAERRARLGRRHALSPTPPRDDPVARQRRRSWLCTAPTRRRPFLAALGPHARRLASPTSNRRSTTTGSLVRVLAMRRTVFAVPRDLRRLPASSARADTVAGSNAGCSSKMLAEAEIDRGPRRVGRPRREGRARPRSRRPARSPAPSSARSTTTPRHAFVLAPGTSTETTPGSGQPAADAAVGRGRDRPRASRAARGRRRSSAGATLDDRGADLGERPARSTTPPPSSPAGGSRRTARRPRRPAWWTGWTKTRTRAAARRCEIGRGRPRRSARAASSPDDDEPVGRRPSRGWPCCRRSTRHHGVEAPRLPASGPIANAVLRRQRQRRTDRLVRRPRSSAVGRSSTPARSWSTCWPTSARRPTGAVERRAAELTDRCSATYGSRPAPAAGPWSRSSSAS